jgi:CARDB
MHFKGMLTAVCGIGAVFASAPAWAQEGATYDVKIVCGKEEGRVVAPGAYWTAVNLLNPGDEPVRVDARVATALPGFTMGPLSPPKTAGLDPDYAMELDCPSLMEIAEARDFLKGYVTIRATGELVIVAVYTQADREGRAVSVDIERVPPRAARGCPDLRVREIQRPVWDAANRRSVIRAIIQNVGTVPAPSTLARLIDPSTTQPDGAPYNDVVDTGPIPDSGEVTVTFHLSYWVYNPDAALEVTADYKGTLEECDETNNKAEFFEIG